MHATFQLYTAEACKDLVTVAQCVVPGEIRLLKLALKRGASLAPVEKKVWAVKKRKERERKEGRKEGRKRVERKEEMKQGRNEGRKEV